MGRVDGGGEGALGWLGREERLGIAGIWAEPDGGTPAMEGAGGHEGRCGLVQGMHGKEREPKEQREGSGVALCSRLVAHRERGARVATATARSARREGVGLSTVFVGVE